MKSNTTNTNSNPNITATVSHACAACKYRRRKCNPDCILAPHFPSSAHQDFLHTHKLFGVSNICKTIKTLNSFDSKQAAIKSMVFEAKARAADPVGGCHRMVYHLKQQIEYYEKELHRVRQKLAVHKVLASNYIQKPPPPVITSDDGIPIQWFGDGSDYLGDFSKRNFQEMSVGKGNLGFDGFNMKVEKEETSPSCQGSQLSGDNTESFVNLSVSDKVTVAVDHLSEDIKPLLDGFDERFNTILLDSKKVSDCSEKVQLEEDFKPIEEEEEDNQQIHTS